MGRSANRFVGRSACPAAIELAQRRDLGGVRPVAVGARGLEQRRQIREGGMGEKDAELLAHHALADVFVPVAIGAERRLRVVDVQGAQAVEADQALELINERVELGSLGHVPARDVEMARVEADAEPLVAVEAFAQSRQLLERAPHRTAAAGGVLHQEPRRVARVLEDLLHRAGHALERALEAAAVMRADVEDDAAELYSTGHVHRDAHRFDRLAVELVVLAGQVDEIERVCEDGRSEPRALGLEAFDRLGLVVRGAPGARTLDEDLSRLGADLLHSLQRLVEAAGGRYVSADEHATTIPIVTADLKSGKHSGVVTRFPPEPNGYLHIGHAKSIALNFGIANEFGGRCHLRFDDTNPIKEEQEYVDSIQADIRWLGFDWGEYLYFASDYFDQLYEWALDLIRAGKTYVDDLSADEIREHRGTFTEPGRDSPWRDRPAEESRDLFERMRSGEFPDGTRVLRARIDMASPNINLRDPVLYRIAHVTHPRTGDAWCIYPMYDFAHGQSDAIEGVTHSICTLEFEDHRPLYDWLIESLPVPSRPRQIEFARLNLTYTVLSKRVLVRLVNEGHVRGWDDPRMPTISALRRRGFPAEGIRDFVAMVGVAKTDSVVEVGMFEHAVRDVLNRMALRRFAVLHPLKLVIENYPEGQIEEMDAVNNPEDASAGTRKIPFTRELWIEREDFMEDPPKKFFRLAPGREVRLRYAYFVTCTEVVKDASGEIVELRCTYDPATRGGDAPDGRRPKATLHWLSVAHAVPAEVRLFDYLFTEPYHGYQGRDL